MSYAIKIGTIAATWIDDQPTPEGCVRYDGEFVERMVWDDSLQSIRPMTTEEINRADIAPVSAAQFRLALLDVKIGLLDEVEAFVAQASREIKLNWEYRQEFDRNHPLVIGSALALGKTPEEMDAVFALAKTK